MFPLGLLLVGFGIAGLLGRGLLSEERVQRRDGVLGNVGPGLAIGGGVALILVDVLIGVAVVVGLGGGEDDEPTVARSQGQEQSQAPVSAEEEHEEESTPAGEDVEPTVGRELGDADGLRGPTVEMRVAPPAEDEFPTTFEVVDQLDSPTVLTIRVVGSDPGVAGVARQCALLDRERCANPVPFQVSADGSAVFQYLVSDDLGAGIDAGRCAATGPRCSIVLFDADGERGAQLDTIFADALPVPGGVHVSPNEGLEDGDTITVTVQRYPPGAEVTAMLCAAPSIGGTERCGPPGATAPITVGPDGTASVDLTVRAGPLGTERAPCDRRAPCGVAVVGVGTFTRAPVAEIQFAQPPGAVYSALRVLLGVVGAALLVLMAIVLLRRTDWRPPREGDGHEIDDAIYADLDAAIAALPPDDREDVFS